MHLKIFFICMGIMGPTLFFASEHNGLQFQKNQHTKSLLWTLWDLQLSRLKSRPHELTLTMRDYTDADRNNTKPHHTITAFGHGQTHLAFTPSGKPIKQQEYLIKSAEDHLQELRRDFALLTPSGGDQAVERELNQKLDSPAPEDINTIANMLESSPTWKALSDTLQKMAGAFSIETISGEEWDKRARELLVHAIIAYQHGQDHLDEKIGDYQRKTDRMRQQREAADEEVRAARTAAERCNQAEGEAVRQARERLATLQAEIEAARAQNNGLQESLRTRLQQRLAREEIDMIHEQIATVERIDALYGHHEHCAAMRNRGFREITEKLEQLRLGS